jgi:hypothetical protein
MSSVHNAAHQFSKYVLVDFHGSIISIGSLYFQRDDLVHATIDSCWCDRMGTG